VQNGLVLGANEAKPMVKEILKRIAGGITEEE